MTYSIGFRAPRIADLVARLADQTLDAVDSNLLLNDPSPMTPALEAGEIRLQDLENVREAVLNTVEALDSGDWFGELLSEQGDPAPSVLHHAESVALAPSAKVFWRRDLEHCYVFANGSLSPPLEIEVIPLLSALCKGEMLPVSSRQPDAPLLNFLDEAGALYDPMDVE